MLIISTWKLEFRLTLFLFRICIIIIITIIIIIIIIIIIVETHYTLSPSCMTDACLRHTKKVSWTHGLTHTGSPAS